MVNPKTLKTVDPMVNPNIFFGLPMAAGGGGGGGGAREPGRDRPSA